MHSSFVGRSWVPPRRAGFRTTQDSNSLYRSILDGKRRASERTERSDLPEHKDDSQRSQHGGSPQSQPPSTLKGSPILNWVYERLFKMASMILPAGSSESR